MTTGNASTYGSGPGMSGAGSAQSSTFGQEGTDRGNQGVVDQVKDAAGGLAGQASNAAGDMAGQLKDQAGSRLDDQRGRLADTLKSAAQALHQTGDKLRQGDQQNGNAAQLVDAAADRVDGLGRYLSERRLDDLVGDIERFGRTDPGLFLTGAFGLGLFAARFLKSSRPRPQQSYSRPVYGRQPSYATRSGGTFAGMGSRSPSASGVSHSSYPAGSGYPSAPTHPAGGPAMSHQPSSAPSYAGVQSAGGAAAGTPGHPNGNSGEPEWNRSAGGA
jgi:hypothetical protein